MTQLTLDMWLTWVDGQYPMIVWIVSLIAMFVCSLYGLIIRQPYTRLSILRRAWSCGRPLALLLHNECSCPSLGCTMPRIPLIPSVLSAPTVRCCQTWHKGADTTNTGEILYKHQTIFVLNIHIKPKTFQIIVQGRTKKLSSEGPVTY